MPNDQCLMTNESSPPFSPLTDTQVRETVARSLSDADYAGKRVLLIIPDGTRTAPVGLMFKTIHAQIGAVTKHFDILVALGTHPPMSEEAICQRLEISLDERRSTYAKVRLLQSRVGQSRRARRKSARSPPRDIAALTERPVLDGRAGRDQQARVRLRPGHHRRPGVSARSRRLLRRQQVPVPGRGRAADPEFLPLARRGRHQPDDHRQQMDARCARWWTAPARWCSVDKLCFAMVVAPDKSLAGLYFGTPEAAWDAASELSRQIHIIYKDQAVPDHPLLRAADV